MRADAAVSSATAVAVVAEDLEIGRKAVLDDPR
jgi:hypothetical protein